MKFAARIPVKRLFPAWSMMPRCPTMTSYGSTWAAMVGAIDASEVLELKTLLYLGFLLGPCVRVAGTGAGGASGAGGWEVDWVADAACLTCTTSNKALSLVAIVGTGAGAVSASGAGGREMDWVAVTACLTCCAMIDVGKAPVDGCGLTEMWSSMDKRFFWFLALEQTYSKMR